MSVEQNLRTISRIAGADFSTTGQYLFGKIGTDGKVELAGDGENAAGVIQDNPEEDQALCLGTDGVSIVEFGGSITAGDRVAANASGEAVQAASGDYVMGIALETGVDGDQRPVLLQKNGIEPA